MQKDLGHVLGRAAPAPGPAVVVGRVLVAPCVLSLAVLHVT